MGFSPNGLATALPGAGTSYNALSSDIYQKIIQHTMVTLTSAQIIAMFTTPQVLLPALAALPASPYGQTYVIEDITFAFIPGSVAFTGGGAITAAFTGGAAVANVLAAAVLTVAGASPPSVSTRQGIDATATVGAAISLSNATGAFAGGNGSLQVDIDYRIVGGVA